MNKNYLSVVSSSVVLSLLFTTSHAADKGPAATYFLEAEQFENLGGWDVDQQSLEQVGSCYLLAHGLGVAVDDASTTLKVEQPGEYKVWVRTRDWVAPWKKEGAPGKFQLLVNGKPLPTVFGTESDPWAWQSGGTVSLHGTNTIALHDMTGFNGRCDALIFSTILISFRQMI